MISGRRPRAWGAWLVGSLLLLGGTTCGFRPLRSQLGGRPSIRVDRAVSEVPGLAQASLAEEVATGVRTELAKYGALSGDPTADRLEVRVVRWEEMSEGAQPGGDARSRTTTTLPTARGIRLRLTVRGEVSHEDSRWETDDVEVDDVVSSQSHVEDAEMSWTSVRASGARDLARRAGARLAREVLGLVP